MFGQMRAMCLMSRSSKIADSGRSISSLHRRGSMLKYVSGRRRIGISPPREVARTSSPKRDALVALTRRDCRVSEKWSPTTVQRSCQSIGCGGSSMMRSSWASGLVRCLRNVARFAASPVKVRLLSFAKAPRRGPSRVRRTAALRASEKSNSSPLNTPLSVPPTELGVE